MTQNIIETVEGLKHDLDAMRPLPPDVIGRVAQKIRLEFNYHSNAIEGNTLTLGETRNLILHGLTADGKPMRDHLDIEGHNDAVKAIEEAVRVEEALNGVFIRNLHAILLKEPYEMNVLTPDGRLAKRLITVGQYKTVPNNVRTSTGEIYYYTPPEQVGSEMTDLIDWYREEESRGEHPIVLAATFHYRFVRIHPFDDGNGRMARLLMNMILIRHGYTVAIVVREERNRYIREIEDVAETEDLSRFIEFIAACCEYTLGLHLRAARGESVEDADDINRQIEVFKRTMLGRAKSGTSVEGRRYVEDVVLPLEQYCMDKLNRLVPDIIPVVFVTGTARVGGTGTDGKAFSLPSGYDRPDTSSIPDDVAHLQTSLGFILPDCHVAGNTLSFHININGRSSTTENYWDFAAECHGDCRDIRHENKHEGHDIEELYRQFDEVIRWIMASLVRAARNGIGDESASMSNRQRRQQPVIRMKVSAREARLEISRIGHARCQQALSARWRTRKDGLGNDYATAQSICWLFCWCKTGMNSPRASREAQAAFDAIFDRPYNWLDRRLDHDLARTLRYMEGDVEKMFYSSISSA